MQSHFGPAYPRPRVRGLVDLFRRSVCVDSSILAYNRQRVTTLPLINRRAIKAGMHLTDTIARCRVHERTNALALAISKPINLPEISRTFLFARTTSISPSRRFPRNEFPAIKVARRNENVQQLVGTRIEMICAIVNDYSFCATI